MVSDDVTKVIAEYLDLISRENSVDARARLYPSLSDLTADSRFKALVRADLEGLVSSLDLDLTEPLWRVLLIQSVLGHAQNGHGMFANHNSVEKIRYPQATIPDIIKAAGMDVGKTKQQRQRPIRQFEAWIGQALEGKVSHFTLEGEPLMGVRFLQPKKIESIEAVLQGAAIMGFVDSYTVRQAALRHYGFKDSEGGLLTLGGGETYLVNHQRLVGLGLHYDFLASLAHSDVAIDLLKQAAVIMDNPQKAESAYIRRKSGAGTSDDLAFIMIGSGYGQDAMIGAFLVDAIDTYDKCIAFPAEKGKDEQIADYILKSWKHKTGCDLVVPKDIYKIIYYSAKKNVPVVNVSSSHRWLVQFFGEGRLYRPMISSHLAFLQGEATGEFKVGFAGGLGSKTFYARAKSRMERLLNSA